MEAGQHLVEVDVAGARPGDGVAPFVEEFEAVEVGRQEILDLGRGVGDAPLSHLEHPGLGVVDRLDHVVGHTVGGLGDLVRDRDEPPQQGVLLDDLGVVGGVADGRRGGLQIEEQRRSPDLVEQAGPGQLLGHGDGVDGLAGAVEAHDGVVHVAVGRLVEVIGIERFDHLGDRLARQQHRPEDRFLRPEVVRRHTCWSGGIGPLGHDAP